MNLEEKVLENKKSKISHIKSGDECLILSGDHKGKKCKILKMLKSKMRAVVESPDITKKGSKEKKGKPINLNVASLHISNLKRVSKPNKASK